MTPEGVLCELQGLDDVAESVEHFQMVEPNLKEASGGVRIG